MPKSPRNTKYDRVYKIYAKQEEPMFEYVFFDEVRWGEGNEVVMPYDPEVDEISPEEEYGVEFGKSYTYEEMVTFIGREIVKGLVDKIITWTYILASVSAIICLLFGTPLTALFVIMAVFCLVMYIKSGNFDDLNFYKGFPVIMKLRNKTLEPGTTFKWVIEVPTEKEIEEK